MKRNRLYTVMVAALMTAGIAVPSAEPAHAANQTTAFTYQGQLQNSSGLVNNTSPGATFVFTLQDMSGNTVTAPQNPVTVVAPVVDGVFAANVDFGLIFGTTQYQLMIQVQDG